MSVTLSLPLSQFSASSRTALEWAYTQARLRLQNYPQQAQQNRPPTSEVIVEARDLLAGVLLSHPKDAQPLQLLQYFQIAPDILYKDLDLKPEAVTQPQSISEDFLRADDVQRILDESIRLASQYNKAEQGLVRLRDLFGGILTIPNEAQTLLRSCLDNTTVSFEEIANTYINYLESSTDSYTEVLRRYFPNPHTRFTFSGFSTDIPIAHGEDPQDLVGIGAEIDAFAYLIAATTLQPPLAIGLFGDWGAGKSFFMEALRRRIDKITNDVKTVTQKDSSIFKSVVQIEFNAWHYVEGELWASLVEHIFRNLQSREEEEPEQVRIQRQHLHDQLKLVNERKDLAETSKQVKSDKLVSKRNEVTDLQQKRNEKLKALSSVKAQDVLKTIKLEADDQAKLDKILKDLGITETYTTSAEFAAAVTELQAVLQRGNALMTVLHTRDWRWVLGLIAVLFSGPLISLIMAFIAQRGLIQIPSVTNALTSISVVLGFLTFLLKSVTTWSSKALDQVEEAQRILDERRRVAEEDYAKQIATAQQAYEDAQDEYERAKSEAQTLAAQVAILEQEIAQLSDPARLLNDFVVERMGSEDYRKYLGLPALIRRNFDALSYFITQANKKILEGSENVENLNVVNRIVLYIDDLDRCPPDRVVQVLQAVHMLLAFPLFVVVVAVDARWLSQSLKKHYAELLTTTRQSPGLTLSGGFARQATPQDYLEKIFQIPFWVRSLSENARIRIVNGLLESSLVRESNEPKPGSNNRADGGDKNGVPPTPAHSLRRVEWPPEERVRALQLAAKANPKPPSLDIDKRELNFIADLKLLLGRTPRSVKRFVNIYRLIKAVALTQTATFVDDAPEADFKRVLFLLAILTGLPTIAHEFFHLLHKHQMTAGNKATLATILGELRQMVTAEQLSTTPALPPTGATNSGHATSESKELPESIATEEWDALYEFQRLESWINQRKEWLDFKIDLVADWMPQVTRFSFRLESYE